MFHKKVKSYAYFAFVSQVAQPTVDRALRNQAQSNNTFV